MSTRLPVTASEKQLECILGLSDDKRTLIFTSWSAVLLFSSLLSQNPLQHLTISSGLRPGYLEWIIKSLWYEHIWCHSLGNSVFRRVTLSWRSGKWRGSQQQQQHNISCGFLRQTLTASWITLHTYDKLAEKRDTVAWMKEERNGTVGGGGGKAARAWLWWGPCMLRIRLF